MGVAVLEVVVTETIARQPTSAEIFHQHIALGRQPFHQSAPLRLRHVHAQRALVAVGAKIISALGGVCAVGVAHVGRSPLARVVAGPRPFHLDDVGAQIAQQLGAGGTRQDAAQVQDPDSVQGAVARTHVFLGIAVSASGAAPGTSL